MGFEEESEEDGGGEFQGFERGKEGLAEGAGKGREASFDVGGGAGMRREFHDYLI